ncbi:hypothetical protein C2S51_038667 [Perilla frutescens var. frutescens]|nr:hypothetical protein C2S51_038667 [Perilla frutescens var. frutescens]
MDLHPTPYPVKSQNMKPKFSKKIPEPQKINAKGGSLLHSCREKRVFGTARNPNIPPKMKTAPEKPVKGKPATGLLKKATKPSLATRSSIIRPPVVEAKKSSEKTLARPKKKGVYFRENKVERNMKFLDDGNFTEPHTPVNAVIAKPRFVTPYHSAEKCSKCRFDKLETASYWLSQIKLAESVGKHSVSAAFFALAFECNAEPIRNLRVELKKYLARHEHLNEEVEWKKLSVSYGLMKEESCTNGEDIKAASLHNHEDEDLPNQIAQGNKS